MRRRQARAQKVMSRFRGPTKLSAATTAALDAMMEQEAQSLLPAGAIVHRDEFNARWRVNFPPHGMVSRSFAKYSVIGSLKLILQWAWNHFLEYECIEYRHCPVIDIQPEFGADRV